MNPIRQSQFPAHCACGSALARTFDTDTKWPWATYECGTTRAGAGTEPFPDSGKMTERTHMCEHTIRLRQSAGITTSRAAKLWKEHQK